MGTNGLETSPDMAESFENLKGRGWYGVAPAPASCAAVIWLENGQHLPESRPVKIEYLV